jgi:hypothetical protein
MRPGVESYTSEEDDRTFMQFGPLIMSGLAERLTHSGGAGKLQSVLVNLDRDSVLIMKFRDGYLALSVDRDEAFGVFQEIDAKLRELAQESSKALSRGHQLSFSIPQTCSCSQFQ